MTEISVGTEMVYFPLLKHAVEDTLKFEWASCYGISFVLVT